MAMFNKLKQFNDLRKKANSLRSKLAEETVTVEEKGITIVMDGNQEVKSVTVAPELLHADKQHQVEQHIKDAINESVKKVQRVMATKMRESGEFNIPGLS